uniref:Uncharacterized protein n=1 Tax=Arundo donax TaxID=35708 RepID=A0A0A9BWV1_ARUDO
MGTDLCEAETTTVKVLAPPVRYQLVPRKSSAFSLHDPSDVPQLARVATRA